MARERKQYSSHERLGIRSPSRTVALLGLVISLSAVTGCLPAASAATEQLSGRIGEHARTCSSEAASAQADLRSVTTAEGISGNSASFAELAPTIGVVGFAAANMHDIEYYGKCTGLTSPPE